MHIVSSRRGLSLIELLVGTALGLLVLAGAGQVLIAHLNSHARLVEHSRVSQELRAVADVMARDLRRAGHWRAALQGVSSTPIVNVYRTAMPSPVEGVATQLRYHYSRDEGIDNNAIDTHGHHESFGFELQDGVIHSRVSGASQALTDAGALHVTQLQITPRHLEVSTGDRCVGTSAIVAAGCCRPHEGDATRCKPRVLERTPFGITPAGGEVPVGSMRVSSVCPEIVIRRFDIRIRGRATSRPNDPAFEATQSVVVRNDEVRETACPPT